MRRYFFHLGVFHLQIHDTKMSTPGHCLAADWISLAEIGGYQIPGYPHAYRCGRGRTMTRSRCLALRNSDLLPTSLLLAEIAGFLKKPDDNFQYCLQISVLCHPLPCHLQGRRAQRGQDFLRKTKRTQSKPSVKNKSGVRSSKGGELSGLAWPAAAFHMKCLRGIRLMGCFAGLPWRFHNLGWNPAQP